MSDWPGMRTIDFRKQPLELEGWTVYITSCRIGERYLAEVEVVASGVTIARATDVAPDVAEEQALQSALKRLGGTRRFDFDLTVGG